jgi:hypothetical protein
MEGEEEVPEGWTKIWSKTYKKNYYFHAATGKTQWILPDAVEGAGASAAEAAPLKKAGGGAASSSSSSSSSSSKEAGKVEQKTAIIVPFRDLHEEQKRKQHLEVFIPALTEYLSSTKSAFKIFIVEQSDDGRKFNRGKLLNIGYKIAEKQQCTTFIFHDVDLIPSDELKHWYTSIPEHPAHIARVWNRYSDNPKYFGGVVSFSRDQYRSINGFPNNFWGWGGEDDEMYQRVKRQNMTTIYPTSGSLQDLEEMTLQTKLQFLKKNPTWKCMNKNEMLEEGDEWKVNGLSSLRYREISCTARNAHCDIIQVDVMENNHWSDLVCKNGDTQYDKPVEQLKAKFAAMKQSSSTSSGVSDGGSAADASKKRKHGDR